MFIRLSFVTLVLAVLALGTPVKRDTEKVLMDIDDIRDKSQALDDSIRAYGGTPQQLAVTLEAVQNLEEATKRATYHVKDSGEFSNADASAIIEPLRNRVAPIVKQGLFDLIGKKDAFAQQGSEVVDIARENLMELKADTDKFTQAIYQGVPTDKQPEVRELKTQIDDEFAEAIKAYST